MVNTKINASILASLLYLEAILMLACVGVGLYYGERDLSAFVLPMCIAVALGSVLKFYSRGADRHMSRRDGYLIVSITWVIFTAVGMLPLLVGGYETRVAAAFFEIMSLPTMGTGDLKLFSAEATGMKLGQLHPRIRTTAQWLWAIYLTLTVSCAFALWLAGMSPFDAVNHAMSTAATGGFSTHQDGIAWFRSSAVEYVELAFMFLASINFTLLYLLIIKGRLRSVLRDGELRCFVLLCVGASAFIAASLIVCQDYPLERALREAAFHVVSCQSTTGFIAFDFREWPAFTLPVMLFIMAVGACAGSTTGGFKCVRLLTLARLARSEFKHILHPRAMLPVRIDGTTLTSQVVRTLTAFTALYLLLHIVSTFILVWTGLPFLDALAVSISSFSNVGPAFGQLFSPLDAWNSLSDVGLWTCSFMMLAGRLEIFSLLLPLFPSFWREN